MTTNQDVAENSRYIVTGEVVNDVRTHGGNAPEI
jgi:hypothetical protein